MKDDLILKVVKTWTFCYFTFGLTFSNIKVSAVLTPIVLSEVLISTLLYCILDNF